MPGLKDAIRLDGMSEEAQMQVTLAGRARWLEFMALGRPLFQGRGSFRFLGLRLRLGTADQKPD